MGTRDQSDSRQNYFFSNPIPMWIYDLDTLRFLEVNTAAIERYGYTRDEFLAMSIAEIRPSDDLPALQANISRVTDGIDHAGIWRHMAKDGTLISVEITSHTLIHEGHKAELVSAVDVTRLVEIEAAYARSEERYRAVSELTSDYAYAFRVTSDHELEFEWGGGGLEEMTGYTPETLNAIGGWQALVHEDDLKIAMSQFDALGSGSLETVEYRIRTRDGLVRWVRDSARAVMDQSGKQISHVFGAIADITEQRLADEKSTRTTETLQTILDSMDATVYVADLETHEVLFANKKIKETFGNQLVGQVCHRVFRNLDQPCPFCTNPRIVDANGQPTDLVIWEAQNPLTGRWFLNYDRAVRWPDDRIVRVQIATDITEKRAAEANTWELERQLQQTRKMEALGTLSGGIAHDFNNILSAILGFTELGLGELPPGSRARGHLKDVLTAGHRAKDLVRQILTFSRQADPVFEPTDVYIVVTEAVNLLRSTLPSTISVALDAAPVRTTVLGDATQLHQVVVNLCTNAAHAMEETGGTLSIGFGNVGSAGIRSIVGQVETGVDYLEIIVGDTGAGIPAEVIDHIFDPFFTTKEIGKGSGMGLAVVHGIVEAHHGHIEVESQPDRGTQFQVYLPVVHQSVAAIDQAAPEKSEGGDETILLVDDEPQLISLLKNQLTTAGYTVSAHPDGVEALEEFKSDPERFDLVFTDLTMPEMTGDRLAREIRALRPEIPIVMSTGFGPHLTEELVEELRLSAVLLKPVERKEVLSTVRRLLDR